MTAMSHLMFVKRVMYVISYEISFFFCKIKILLIKKDFINGEIQKIWAPQKMLVMEINLLIPITMPIILLTLNFYTAHTHIPSCVDFPLLMFLFWNHLLPPPRNPSLPLPQRQHRHRRSRLLLQVHILPKINCTY